MLTLGSLALQRTRTLVTRLFHRFGIHCATHQIRIILVSCVVITSLFYPALAIYASSQAQTLSDSTSRILDAFIGAKSVSGIYLQHDLRNVWEGHSELRIRDDPVFRARCGKGRTLRVERILIRSPGPDDVGVLNHQTLIAALHLERRISSLMSSHGINCLRSSDHRCFSLSPLAFWDHNEMLLLAESDIFGALRLSNNISVAGIPVTPHMVLAGRGTNEHVVDNLSFARFLVLSYFFPETDCLGRYNHSTWLRLLEQATPGDELVLDVQAPTLVALEYDPNLSRNTGFSAISAFLYVAYSAFFVYVTWSMRRMDAVHSRIGLTFTALIEIAVSTITSLSVCALVGFKVTMVPWELLPIVIVFVGAENMFNLVDAVGKTSVTLPVKERIADGLSRAGTSNTLKVVSYNSILGVIAFFAVGAIRQFCAFAIVVLVAHWFLAHTFFMAVLSIDIQRLELEELIRQNASLAPTVPTVPSSSNVSSPQSLSTWHKFVVAVQSLLRARAMKNISLFLLLAITCTLYYTTYPASVPITSNLNNASPMEGLGRAKPSQGGFNRGHQSSAWHVWKLFNPNDDPLVHLRIEMPTILTFIPENHNQPSGPARPHSARQTFRPIFWMIKIVVLPITATTMALYGLLLYLLKDADLLAAQRHRAEPGSKPADDKNTLEGMVEFMTLPRAFDNDVELIAASKDGKVVVCVGLENEVVIWRTGRSGKGQPTYDSVDVTDFLLRAASMTFGPSAITSVAVDDNGDFCAIGTAAGIIGVWFIRDRPVALPHLCPENVVSTVTTLQFVSPLRHSASHTQPSSPVDGTVETCLLSIHDHWLATKWTVSALATTTRTPLPPLNSGHVRKTTPLRILGNNGLLLAYSMADGTLEIMEVLGSQPPLLSECSFPAGNPSDFVSKVHACQVELVGENHLIIGAATDAGVVSLWDGSKGECIAILDEVFGTVDAIRISSVARKTCRYCGELPLESFSVSLSVRHVVLFYRAYLSVQNRRCSCAHNQPRQPRETVIGRRSRSNSAITSGATVSLYHRARLSASSSHASVLDTSLFPVSGHGVHSRRASENIAIRRQDNVTASLTVDDVESPSSLDPVLNASSSRSSFWQNIVVVRTGDATCERGGWDVAGRTVFGLRRRPRPNGKIRTTQPCLSGLTKVTLERWELWTFDPSLPLLRNSSLAALLEKRTLSRRSSIDSHLHPWTDNMPGLPFTRVSSFVVCPSFCLAGFGNTVGLFKYALE